MFKYLAFLAGLPVLLLSLTFPAVAAAVEKHLPVLAPYLAAGHGVSASAPGGGADTGSACPLYTGQPECGGSYIFCARKCT